MVPGVPSRDCGTGYENLVDMLDNSTRYSTMAKGKTCRMCLQMVSSFLRSNI